jgi:hypothetical protein
MDPRENNGALSARILKSVFDQWFSCCVYVAARLNIADQLANGPLPIETLAAANGSHTPSLYRVLRALAGEGIFEETSPGVFGLTPEAVALQSDSPASMKAFVQALLGEHYHAWGQLLYSVQTGGTAFDHYYGMDLWKYYDTHPQDGINFMNAMTGMSELQLPHIVAAYDFSAFNTIIDVAGGNGALMLAVLEATPGLKGVIFDQPYVAERTAEVIATRQLAERCRVVPGNFFGSIPAGADAYMMKYILHDWHDADALRILKNIYSAMPRGGKLLVIDAVIPEGNVPNPGKFMDVNMLVATGGRERTAREFEALFEQAGLRLNRVIDLTIPDMSIVEGEKV